MKGNFKYIALYFLMFIVHFIIFKNTTDCCETIFIKYYLFLTLVFMMVITIMSIIKIVAKDYLGFIFMGLIFLKLILMFLVMNKLNLKEVPHYKLQFIVPYLISLVLITLYCIGLIRQNEKNH